MSKKILIIDDDEGILEALAVMLESADHIVETSTKGECAESLHDTNGNLPALIILDVLLSGKDGRDICRKLKRQNDTSEIPVIMISAHPDAEKSVKEVGADEFLAKPFDMNDLLTKVEKYVGQR